MHHNHNHQHRVLTFSHFSRKGWALFSCLGREVRIGILAAATLLTASQRLNGSTLAQLGAAEGQIMRASTLDTLHIPQVDVTGTRAPLAASLAARQVTTLGRAETNAAGVVTIADMLKTLAALDVRQRGPFGMQTDISIDGGTFDQTTWLIDGMPFNNPQTGHNVAQFPLSLSDIERIEVLEGAAAKAMGTQAFSGAVNIVTRRDSYTQTQAQFDLGSYGTAQLSLRQALKINPQWHTSLSATLARSDGATQNSDFKNLRAYWQTRYEGSFSLQAQAGLTINDFGANTFYSTAYPNQWEATRRYHIGLSAQTRGTLHLQPTISWVRSTDHFQLTRHSAAGENFNRTDMVNLGLNAWVQTTLGRTAVGAEMRHESLLSRNLGLPLDTPQWVAIAGEDSLMYNRSAERTNLSLYAEHNIISRHFTLSIGLMATRHTTLDHRLHLYPGIDLAYRPTERWQIFASWNKAMRMPTFTDLWYRSPTQQGNTTLRPEQSSALRLGATYTCPHMEATLKAFYNHGTNMIDWVMHHATDRYHATNFRLHSYGLSARITLSLSHIMGHRQPLERLTIGYAWNHQNRRDTQPVFRSNYAMEYLRHKLTATLLHRIAGPLSATWNFRLWHRNGHYLAGPAANPTLEPYGTSAIVDARINWKATHFEAYLDLSNLTATRYFDIAGVAQPRFTMLAGVKFTW